MSRLLLSAQTAALAQRTVVECACVHELLGARGRTLIHAGVTEPAGRAFELKAKHALQEAAWGLAQAAAGIHQGGYVECEPRSFAAHEIQVCRRSGSYTLMVSGCSFRKCGSPSAVHGRLELALDEAANAHAACYARWLGGLAPLQLLELLQQGLSVPSGLAMPHVNPRRHKVEGQPGA